MIVVIPKPEEKPREEEPTEEEPESVWLPHEEPTQEWHPVILELLPHLRKKEKVTWQRVAGEREYFTPEQFAEKYGTKVPKLPSGSEIMYVRKTDKGIQFYYRTPAKTATEHFIRTTQKHEPPFDLIGVRRFYGAPVGGDPVTPFLMLGEATVGEVEEHILGKPTPRSELMTPEQIILSYGLMIGTAAAVKYAPKIWGAIKPRIRPSQATLMERQLTWKQPKIAKYIVSKKGATFEFWQQIVETPLYTEMTKPSRLLKPLMFRGTPTTPMATTLAKALMKDTRGVVHVGRGVLPKLTLKPKLSPLMTRAFPIRVAAPKRISMAKVLLGVSPWIAEGLRRRRIPAVAPVVATAELQVQEQMVTSLSRQILETRQVQKQMQMLTPLSRHIFQRRMMISPVSRLPRRIKRRKRVVVESPFSRYFFKRHPVPTGSQVMKHILGRKRR